ncbi:hypothetical protein [Streptomyces scopuliridis]|uniref:zinc finger domain-containing protein n=1 Tax=Streptomyces scopuliridis TaxID=452529 RepID=UPI0036B9A0AB
MEQFDCPTCEVPAGSTCRTRGGKVAPKYHTPRFMLVPQLRADLEVKTPSDSGPGRAWRGAWPSMPQCRRGRPKVVDDDMADYARALRTQGVTVPQIARKLVIPSGKNKGEHPSVATVYRLLAEADTADDTDE